MPQRVPQPDDLALVHHFVFHQAGQQLVALRRPGVDGCNGIGEGCCRRCQLGSNFGDIELRHRAIEAIPGAGLQRRCITFPRANDTPHVGQEILGVWHVKFLPELGIVDLGRQLGKRLEAIFKMFNNCLMHERPRLLWVRHLMEFIDGFKVMTDFVPAKDLTDYRATRPDAERSLNGAYVTLTPFDAARHGHDLFEAGHAGSRAEVDARWRYLPVHPFDTKDALSVWVQQALTSRGVTYVVVDEVTGKAQGMASCINIVEANGSIEIGAIMFGPKLTQTRAATEAVYLLAEHAFETLGYRRLEWKCNNDNAASKAAALRFGFTFEGVFRQHMIVKGLNRDTAWFSITDSEWSRIKSGFRTWLQGDNFDENKHQLKNLQDCMSP